MTSARARRCARAAALGHVDALRELGGTASRTATACGELTLALAAVAALRHAFAALPLGAVGGAAGCPLLSEFGWSLTEAEPHAANQVMV